MAQSINQAFVLFDDHLKWNNVVECKVIVIKQGDSTKIGPCDTCKCTETSEYDEDLSKKERQMNRKLINFF